MAQLATRSAAAAPRPPTSRAAGGARPWGRAARSLWLALCAAALAVTFGAALPAVAAPSRVVSINLCTDQLAMMLAAPGQLLSVSWLAVDPRSSAMAAEAARYPLNHAQAEEVFLMHPDLVLAGSYSAPATLGLLRRLGVAVVTVPPARTMEDIRAQVLLVGRALGRTAAAEALAARFDARLAALRPAGAARKTAALYYPNGYSPGAGTLADAILSAAGFRNLAAETGRTGAGTLPLERLVMAAPDVIVTARPYAGASRAEGILAHPALRAVEARARVVESGADWVCGTPLVLDAVAALEGAG